MASNAENGSIWWRHHVRRRLPSTISIWLHTVPSWWCQWRRSRSFDKHHWLPYSFLHETWSWEVACPAWWAWTWISSDLSMYTLRTRLSHRMKIVLSTDKINKNKMKYKKCILFIARQTKQNTTTLLCNDLKRAGVPLYVAPNRWPTFTYLAGKPWLMPSAFESKGSLMDNHILPGELYDFYLW